MLLPWAAGACRKSAGYKAALCQAEPRGARPAFGVPTPKQRSLQGAKRALSRHQTAVDPAAPLRTDLWKPLP